MTHAEYAAIEGINWSSLKHLGVSAHMYRHRLNDPEPSKPAFIFGGAAHCAILEPERFDERYGVFDGTRRGKEWDRWQAENPDRLSLKPSEMERVRRVADAVIGPNGHRVARTMLRGGRVEEATTWTDEVTGLRCKGRLDYIRPDVVVDLKTTRNPDPQKFERDAASYGYIAQCAFYHDGAKAARRIDGRERPYIIAARSDDDFDVAVFQLTESTLDVGRRIYRSLLQRLMECTTANYWPGVAPQVVQLGVPPWASAQIVADDESEDF